MSLWLSRPDRIRLRLGGNVCFVGVLLPELCGAAKRRSVPTTDSCTAARYVHGLKKGIWLAAALSPACNAHKVRRQP
jgi:hypothetical protein